MIGKTLAPNEKHFKLASSITQEISKINKNKAVICISAEQNTGREELAFCIGSILRDTYNIPAKVISSENYYKLPPKQKLSLIKDNNIENIGPEEIEWQILIRNIEDFFNNRKSELPCIDLISNEIDIITTDFSKVNVLIIEGLYPCIIPQVDLKIFIDGNFNNIKDDNSLSYKILKKQHIAVQALKKTANILINSNLELV